MRTVIKIIFLFLVTIKAVHAQILPNLGGQRVGTSAAQFLKIGVGSRSAALGQAYVALANDAEALYWNPAGISQFDKNEVIFANTQWFVDTQLEFAGIVYHLSQANSIGFSVTYLHTEEMKETTVLQPFGTGRYFNYSDALLSLTFARNMTERFSFGLSVKYMNETLAELTMQSFLFDLGTYYKTGWKSVRFGVAVSNFGRDMAPSGSFRYENLENEIVEVNSFQEFSPPTVFRIGVASELFENDQHKFISAVQLNHPNDNDENVNLGLEYWWKDVFSLRGGYVSGREEENFSLGFGVHLPLSVVDFRFDYAFSNFGRLGYVNRFTAHLQF